EILLGRARLAEINQARNAGGNIQLLSPLTKGNGCVFVTEAKVHRYVLPYSPAVAGIPEDANLVSIVRGVAQAAFRQVVGIHIAEIKVHGIVVIVAAGALREGLRRDELTCLHPELERVASSCPGCVIDGLVQILNRELRRVGVWAYLQPEVEEEQVGETVQTRERKIAGRGDVIKTVESYTQLVRKAWIKRVILSQRSQVELGWRREKEGRKRGSVVESHCTVVNVAAT